jgi:hypothetical protein
VLAFTPVAASWANAVLRGAKVNEIVRATAKNLLSPMSLTFQSIFCAPYIEKIIGACREYTRAKSCQVAKRERFSTQKIRKLPQEMFKMFLRNKA